jgi:hypothetical protein
VTPRSARQRSNVILRGEHENGARAMRPFTFPGSQDFVWVVVGWTVLYTVLKWLRTDGSDYSVRMFDDSSWPDIILISWPAVYWTVSRVLLP